MSINNETLDESALTVSTILKQCHKELKEMRGMGCFNKLDSSGAPSDFDTSYDKSIQHCPKHPCHSRESPPLTVSDYLDENSAAAASTFSSPDTTLGECCSNNYNDALLEIFLAGTFGGTPYHCVCAPCPKDRS